MSYLYDIIDDDLKQITSNSRINWELLEGKTVLISGANGFLPSYLVEVLLFLNQTRFKNKTKIIAMVRNLSKAKKRFSRYLNREDLVFLVQDVNDPVGLKEEVHFIIHAASLASPKFYKEYPVETLLPNVLGTYQLLRFSERQPLEGFLFLSSGAVYGVLEDEKAVYNENLYGLINPLNVLSSYGLSKKMGESMLYSWYKEHRVPVKMVRIFYTYGPGMNLSDGRAIGDFVSNIMKNENIVLKSKGDAIRHFCYLADAATAFFLVLLSGKSGEAYNIANTGEGSRSILEIAQLLIKLFPEKDINIIFKQRDKNDPYMESPIIKKSPDINKIKSLGWEIKYTLEKGLKRTIRSFL